MSNLKINTPAQIMAVLSTVDYETAKNAIQNIHDNIIHLRGQKWTTDFELMAEITVLLDMRKTEEMILQYFLHKEFGLLADVSMVDYCDHILESEQDLKEGYKQAGIFLQKKKEMNEKEREKHISEGMAKWMSF